MSVSTYHTAVPAQVTGLFDLARELSCRIETRQTGVRDAAKAVGGIGSCGQELCCTKWLPAFVPVSIKHAKDQGIALNPSKISGQCGRLKCCLRYEDDVYTQLRKNLPRKMERVTTPDGPGRVLSVDVILEKVIVELEEGNGAIHSYPTSSIKRQQRPAG